MSSISQKAKKALMTSIAEIDGQKEQYLNDSKRDFTRNRKLPFSSMLSIIISMAGGSLTNEPMDYFKLSSQAATSSAFIQQRANRLEVS